MKEGSKKVNIKVNTGGNGFWSNVAKEVLVNKIKWYSSGDEVFLQLYLDENTWSQEKDGLVYTDETFQKEIRKELCHMRDYLDELPELPWELASYTEQGMQGGHMFGCPDDCTKCKLYVSMILGVW